MITRLNVALIDSETINFSWKLVGKLTMCWASIIEVLFTAAHRATPTFIKRLYMLHNSIVTYLHQIPE